MAAWDSARQDLERSHALYADGLHTQQILLTEVAKTAQGLGMALGEVTKQSSQHFDKVVDAAEARWAEHDLESGD